MVVYIQIQLQLLVGQEDKFFKILGWLIGYSSQAPKYTGI